MKPTVTIVCLFLIATMASCGSSAENSTHSETQDSANSMLPTDTISITKPSVKQYNIGNVYVDHISKLKHDGKTLLKISGWLPDGCSKLYEADYSVLDNELHLKLKSWRPSEAMCTQALVDFTYITEEISSKKLDKLSHYVIDGKKEELRTVKP